MKIEKLKVPVIIKYIYLKGWTPVQIRDKKNSTLNEHRLSYSELEDWIGEFKKNHTPN